MRWQKMPKVCIKLKVMKMTLLGYKIASAIHNRSPPKDYLRLK